MSEQSEGSRERAEDQGSDGAVDRTVDRDVDRDVDSRAELLPEEAAAGSEDPHEQARAILADSEERTRDPEGTGEESVQTSDPEERGGEPRADA